MLIYGIILFNQVPSHRYISSQGFSTSISERFVTLTSRQPVILPIYRVQTFANDRWSVGQCPGCPVSQQRGLKNYSDDFFFRDEDRNCHKMIRCDDEILALLSSEHSGVGKTAPRGFAWKLIDVRWEFFYSLGFNLCVVVAWARRNRLHDVTQRTSGDQSFTRPSGTAVIL